MARYTGPKNRIARRFGINVFSKARNPLAHKANPPGQHGAKRKKKSDYGVQLENKQKLKAAFGMLTERQFMRYYKIAAKSQKSTPQMFLQLLECRLDNLVFRLKFASTPFQAQQLVAHGHILVNGKRVDRRAFIVRPGMEISIKPASRKLKSVIDATQSSTRALPAYLEVDENNFTGKLISQPSVEDISLPLEVDVPGVCDFLSHKG